VLALLLGLIVGWLLRSIRATAQLRAARAAHTTHATHRPAEPVTQPNATTPGPIDEQALVDEVVVEAAGDDLTRIDGVGPEVVELLRGIGVQSFDALADTEVSLLKTMLADAGPGLAGHVPDEWPTEAARLAGRAAE